MEFDTAPLIAFAKSRIARLAVSYLAIIMVMSIGFSVVFYNTSASELGRRLPPSSFFSQYQDNAPSGYSSYVESRVAQGRQHLFTNLILLNFLALVAGSYVSYLLAERTLEPIEEAMEAQARFASDASHELRTPLAAIQAENEVALRKGTLSEARARKLIQSNLEEVIKLRELADGLLRLAREDNHELTMKPVAASEITTEAMNRVLKTAQAKHIDITDTVPAHLSMIGDQPSLVQIVSVLLDNAIKYSREKQHIFVTAEQKGKFVTLSVQDEGRGIASENLPRIFDRFYRADSARSSQDTSGYGLGLSIAYKIIKQHGGTISVTSALGHGSTFTIKLPLAEPPRNAPDKN
ncbi:MAG: sensor histidine kinase [Candidatus Saccharibacteria bacterium]